MKSNCICDTHKAEKLVRWRADPKKIRVSIRPIHTYYKVTVTSLIDNRSVIFSGTKIEFTIMGALEKAESENFKGIDLGMGRAYTHPWY